MNLGLGSILRRACLNIRYLHSILDAKIYSTPTSLILTQAKIGIVIIFTDRHNLALFTPALKFPLNNPVDFK